MKRQSKKEPASTEAEVGQALDPEKWEDEDQDWGPNTGAKEWGDKTTTKDWGEEHKSGDQGQSNSLRQLLSQSINKLCDIRQFGQNEAYNFLFKRLYEVFGVNVYQLHRIPGQYLIDAIEQNGLMNHICSLALSESSYQEWEW